MSQKDFVALSKSVSTGAAALRKAHPGLMQAFSSVGKAVYPDGVLNNKTKELIALAIGVTVRCDGCVAHHAMACLDKGATREEVVEAIGVAVHMGGGPSMVYGAEALEAYDQHAKDRL